MHVRKPIKNTALTTIQSRLITKDNKEEKVRKSTTELDIFLREQNIAHYRRLVNSRADAAERRTILKLLAEEMSKLEEHVTKRAGKRSAEKVF